MRFEVLHWVDTGADTEKLQIKESFIVMSCAWEEKKRSLRERKKPQNWCQCFTNCQLMWWSVVQNFFSPHCRKLKLTNVEVGSRPHLPVLWDYIDDQRVPYESHQHDEREEKWHQPGICQERVLAFLHLVQGQVPRGIIQQHLWRVPHLAGDHDGS